MEGGWQAVSTIPKLSSLEDSLALMNEEQVDLNIVEIRYSLLTQVLLPISSLTSLINPNILTWTSTQMQRD